MTTPDMLDSDALHRCPNQPRDCCRGLATGQALLTNRRAFLVRYVFSAVLRTPLIPNPSQRALALTPNPLSRFRRERGLAAGSRSCSLLRAPRGPGEEKCRG